MLHPEGGALLGTEVELVVVTAETFKALNNFLWRSAEPNSIPSVMCKTLENIGGKLTETDGLIAETSPETIPRHRGGCLPRAFGSSP